MTRDDIIKIQTHLRNLGFEPGPIDGVMGPHTESAIIAFKRSRGLKATAYVGPITMRALFTGGTEKAARPDHLPWMAEARKVLGLHEVRDNSRLRKWLGSDGHALGDPAKLPWCGDFVETCIRIALPDEPLLGALGSNPYWARNWMLFGQPVRPVIGAVLVFERGSGGHVGFAIGQDDTHFHVLGGNQSDAVTIARIAKSRLLGARWPTTWPPRLQRLQTMKPGDLLITTTNEV